MLELMPAKRFSWLLILLPEMIKQKLSRTLQKVSTSLSKFYPAANDRHHVLKATANYRFLTRLSPFADR